MTLANRLREMIKGPDLVVAPGAYDAMSALLVEKAGFKAVYLGSMAATATLLGKPDIGFLERSEYTRLIAGIADIVDIPIIADAEDGYGDVLAMGRTVRDYERAGAAAMHIEDHEYGKHIDMKPGRGRCVSADEMVGKIKAATDARRNSDTMIIARTDSLWAYGDLQKSIDRVAAYAEAGADMVFIAALGENDIEKVSKAVSVPLINTSAAGQSANHKELSSRGLSALIYFVEPMLAARRAVGNWLDGLRENDGPAGLMAPEPDHTEIDELLGIDTYRSLHARLTE